MTEVGIAEPVKFVHESRYAERWQPRLTDGRRLYRYGSLPDEWRFRDSVLNKHRPILLRSRERALRRAIQNFPVDRDTQRRNADIDRQQATNWVEVH